MKLTPEQLLQWFQIAAVKLLRGPEGAFAKKPGAPSPAIKRKELSGLKTGINDLLAMSEHGSWREVAETDRALRAAGLPSVEEMRSSMHRKEAAMLRRGYIRNEEEYYIAQELLSDADSDLRPPQIAKLDAMAAAYGKRGQQAS